MAKPPLSTIPPFYHSYVQRVVEDDVQQSLENNTRETMDFFNSIPDTKWDYSYAPGKWSIKELVQHMIDSERIFCYRALRFARKDATPLPGFDENPYAMASKANRRSKPDLMEEFGAVRKATELLFGSFDEEQLSSKGTANNHEVSVNGLGFIMAGHVKHHLAVIRERYLPESVQA